MKATATVKCGTFTESFDVNNVSVWYDRVCSHQVSEESIGHLLNEAARSGRMTYDTVTGSIDAFDSTPLYTNGQKSVIELKVNGVQIWNK